MSIEKMVYVDMKGADGDLDEVLCRCARSAVFHPENAAKLSEYSVGTPSLLRNPYGALLIKITEIAENLKIHLSYAEEADLPLSAADRSIFLEASNTYLNRLREEYPRYFERKSRIKDEIGSYTAALGMLSHIGEQNIDFDRLWDNTYLKIRFGRIPTSSLQKLEVYEGHPYELYKLDGDSSLTWCIYATAEEFHSDIDALFSSLKFERLRIPDYVHGTASSAIDFLREGIEKERARSEEVGAEIDRFVERERGALLTLYTRVKFLHDAFDLRRYVVTIRGYFHLVGFVPARESEDFLASFADLAALAVESRPAERNGPLEVPVKLRNNWFARPFEMFVEMYGLPSYSDIDPSPFVAYTYSILFGIMFGDVGQGLCILLLGLFLQKKRGMALGGIMCRIGFSSSLFGVLYGSVFGFEHLLDRFYTGVLGLSEKPVEVMHPDTTNKILIAAIALGASIILMVIVFNICVGLRHRDFERTFLSSNGAAGFIFYSSILFAVVMYLSGRNVLVPQYIVCFFAVPLLVIFFREPIARLVKFTSKDSIIYGDDLIKTTTFQRNAVDIKELFTTQFMTARFGRLPTDNYAKLSFYQTEPFMVYPLKSDRDYIWCIYAMAAIDKDRIDAIFHDLYFERIYIPEEDMQTNELAEAFVLRCIEQGAGLIPDAPEEAAPYHRSVLQRMFPDGIGSFFTESFFEMFEVLLSFVTNTMSFLRVGGFILSHAGMMSVVFTLSGMVGAGASPAVIILGNLFVMALEGLIVGIQCLRLEFYEMFSRFFDAQGIGFAPVRISYRAKTG